MNFWLLLITVVVALGISYFVIREAVLEALQKHTLWQEKRAQREAG
jgi:hypothetical protein